MADIEVCVQEARTQTSTRKILYGSRELLQWLFNHRGMWKNKREEIIITNSPVKKARQE